jgi:hypothetical protein
MVARRSPASEQAAFASATKVAAITLHDTTEQPYMKAIYIGEAGDLKVTINGTAVTFTGLSAGQILPISPTLCWSTGSTAFTAGTILALSW